MNEEQPKLKYVIPNSEELRKCRKRKKITMEQAANYVDKSRQHIYCMENPKYAEEKRTVKYTTIQALAMLYDVDPLSLCISSEQEKEREIQRRIHEGIAEVKENLYRYGCMDGIDTDDTLNIPETNTSFDDNKPRVEQLIQTEILRIIPESHRYFLKWLELNSCRITFVYNRPYESFSSEEIAFFKRQKKKMEKILKDQVDHFRKILDNLCERQRSGEDINEDYGFSEIDIASFNCTQAEEIYNGLHDTSIESYVLTHYDKHQLLGKLITLPTNTTQCKLYEDLSFVSVVFSDPTTKKVYSTIPFTDFSNKMEDFKKYAKEHIILPTDEN